MENEKMKLKVDNGLKPLKETPPLRKMKDLMDSNESPLIDEKLNIALKLGYIDEYTILRIMSILYGGNETPKSVLIRKQTYVDWYKLSCDDICVDSKEFREFSLSHSGSSIFIHDKEFELRFSPREMHIIAISDFIDIFGYAMFNRIEKSMIAVILGETNLMTRENIERLLFETAHINGIEFGTHSATKESLC